VISDILRNILILTISWAEGSLNCVVPENIHSSSTDGFSFEPPHPSGNSTLAVYFPMKKFGV